MNANIEFTAIAQLDLDPIKVKLMHKESGEGWSLAYATMIEGEYRRFLCLKKLFPEEPLAPLFDVDIFWHYHILDTMQYAADCDAVFGHFLHHFPYLGLRGEDDEEAHHRVGARTKELYAATFGTDEAAADGAVVATAWSMTGAANAGADGKTAWSMTGVAGEGAHARTAWSMTGATGEGAHAKTAWSMTGAAQDARADDTKPDTAWSMTGAAIGGALSARPALATMGSAWSMTPSQPRGVSLQRPTLEHAA